MQKKNTDNVTLTNIEQKFSCDGLSIFKPPVSAGDEKAAASWKARSQSKHLEYAFENVQQ